MKISIINVDGLVWPRHLVIEELTQRRLDAIESFKRVFWSDKLQQLELIGVDMLKSILFLLLV